MEANIIVVKCGGTALWDTILWLDDNFVSQAKTPEKEGMCALRVPSFRFFSGKTGHIRTILQFVGVNVVLGKVCTVLAAQMQEMKESNVLRTLKLASGVIIQGGIETNLPSEKSTEVALNAAEIILQDPASIIKKTLNLNL